MTNLTDARIVLTTAGNAEHALQLGRTLVEEGLAACVTLIPAVESIYRWQGQIEHSTETLLLLKTTVGLISALEARLLALHTYDLPEFVVLKVDASNHRYLDWLASGVRATEQ